MNKKVLSLILCILMLAGSVIPAFAEELPEDVPAVSCEAAPAESEAAPAEIEAAPAEIEAAPAEIEAAHAEIEAAPAEIEAEPAETKAEPAEIEAAVLQEAVLTIEPVADEASGENSPEDASADKNGFYQNNNTYAMEHTGNLQVDADIEKIVINEDSIKVMELNPDNPNGYNYSTLSFTFNNNGSSYEVNLTGIKSEYANKYVAEKGTEAYADSLQTMKTLAYNYINGLSNGLHESNDKSEAAQVFYAHNLIDAEKISKDGTDSLLCWAASASDMLWMTGWASELQYQDGKPVFSSEDDVFKYFQNCYTDDGSRQEYGIKFFFNGINMDQAVDETGATVMNDKGLRYNDKFAQQKTNLTSSTLLVNGLVDNVAAENVYGIYFMDETDDFADVLETTAVDAINAGDAVGMNVALYNPDGDGILQRSGGHAITLMGFIKEIGEGISNVLKGIFIADSDDDKDTKPEDPAQRDNNYAYYSLEKVTVGDRVSYKMLNYDGDYIIDSIQTLKNKRLATVEYEPDDAGTRAPAGVLIDDTIYQGSLDIVPTSLAATLYTKQEPVTTIQAGDVVDFHVGMKNLSYRTANGAAEPIVYYTIELYKDGSAEPCDTLDLSCSCGESGILANETFSVTPNHRITEPGNYVIKYRIKGVSVVNPDTGKYENSPEAFISNNEYKKQLTLIVLPMAGGEDGLGPWTADTETEAAVAEVKQKVYTASFICTQEEDVEVRFDAAGTPDSRAFAALYEGDEIIEAQFYTITMNADGSFNIIFSARFLKSLLPGRHIFRLVSGDSSILFEITVA